MKYKDIAPKYMYIIGLLLNFVILGFLGFLNTKVIESRQNVLIILLGIVSMISLFWIFKYLNKYIYLRIDLQENLILYGNIFFYQEIPPNKVEQFKKVFLLQNLYKVKLLGKSFYFIANQAEAEYFKKIIE